MSGWFGSLKRRDSAKLEKKFLKTVEIGWVSKVKVLLSSVTFKFEIKILLGIPRYLKDPYNSFGQPIFSNIFSIKKACFFVAINFFLF